MDKLWELLSLKVIHLTIGKRAGVTRKLQAGFFLSPGFCLCTRSGAQGGAPVVVSHPQQHSCAQARASLCSPQLHTFWHTSFSTHSHRFSHTLTKQDPCLPPYMTWDPAPSASSSPLSFLLPWCQKFAPLMSLVSFRVVARTSLQWTTWNWFACYVGHL